MRPKGKLFALFVIVVAIGLVTATGAFSSVSATRTAEVNVAGDSSAQLQLLPHDGANGIDDGTITASNGYAQLTSSNGELRINLAGFTDGDAPPAGSGPNLNATTDIQGVFNVTNQGTQAVYVNVSDDDQDQTSNSNVVTFYNATHAPLETSPNYGGLEHPDTNGTAVKLDPGETLVVSIYVDTNLVSGDVTGTDPLISSITIYADSDSSVFTDTDSGPGT